MIMDRSNFFKKFISLTILMILLSPYIYLTFFPYKGLISIILITLIFGIIYFIILWSRKRKVA